MVTVEEIKPPAHEHPPLTVLPVADDPDRFYVAGSIHSDGQQWWYEVRLYRESGRVVCECKGFGFRGHCSHSDAVRKYLQKELSCPVCGSFALTSVEYLEGRGYLLVAECKAGGCSYRRVL